MGAVNRCWDVSRFGELTVPDSAALRGNALTLEAWVRTNDPIDSGGGSGIFATNPYQGILFKGSRSSWAAGDGLVRVDDRIRFFLNSWSGHFVEARWHDREWVNDVAHYTR